MPFQFNWVDLIIIIALGLFVWESLGRPFFLELADLISFIFAGFLSFRYYNFPAKLLETQLHIPHGLTLVLGFMMVWFLSEIIFYLIVRLFLARFMLIKFPGSRFLAVIPALLRGLIFIAIILVLTSTFPIQPTIKKAVLDSKLGSKILVSAYSLEGPIKQVFGGLSNESLTFFTIKPKTDEKVDLGFKTDQFTIDTASENEMVSLVNKERVSRGLSALVLDTKLGEVARAHSGDMFRRGYFSHYSPEGKTVADRVMNAGIDFLVVGENLAYAPNVEFAHRGLMNSEGHRANILSPDFNKIGIGALDGGIYGRMFTQVFSN